MWGKKAWTDLDHSSFQFPFLYHFRSSVGQSTILTFEQFPFFSPTQSPIVYNSYAIKYRERRIDIYTHQLEKERERIQVDI